MSACTWSRRYTRYRALISLPERLARPCYGLKISSAQSTAIPLRLRPRDDLVTTIATGWSDPHGVELFPTAKSRLRHGALTQSY
jgi:hypothetical protein